MRSVKILAIDPGNEQSGWCILDDKNLQPKLFGKSTNENVLTILNNEMFDQKIGTVVIERVASYGMPVGRDVFETCEWIGRFTQRAIECGMRVDFVYRKDVKLHICADSRAKDANIRKALIDRFARHDFKNGKGTKKNPDIFYGFKADIWSSYAIGVTYIERKTARNPLSLDMGSRAGVRFIEIQNSLEES